MKKRSIPLYKPSGHNTAAWFVNKLHGSASFFEMDE
jgi:hypothetical protein